jgi:CheY-like chemotaxis protein
MPIVFLDDSMFMRRLIRSALLESHPTAKIEEIGDATRALAGLPDLAPDLITLDRLIPGMNGLAFLTASQARAVRTRVIVLSADVQKTVRQKYHDLGAADFIDQPITLEKRPAVLPKLIAA